MRISRRFVAASLLLLCFLAGHAESSPSAEPVPATHAGELSELSDRAELQSRRLLLALGLMLLMGGCAWLGREQDRKSALDQRSG